MKRKNLDNSQKKQTNEHTVRTLDAKQLTTVHGGIRVTMSDVIISSY